MVYTRYNYTLCVAVRTMARRCNRSSRRSNRVKRLLALWLAYQFLKKRRRTRRSVWIRPIFTRHREQGEYHNLLRELRETDPESHFCYIRMLKEGFDTLLARVKWYYFDDNDQFYIILYRWLLF